MKKYLCMAFTAFSIVITAQAESNKGTADPKTPVAIVHDGIRFCESTYPYQGGILIANFGTEQLNPLNTEGKGYIVYHKEGKNRVLIPADGNLSAPKGMFVRDEYLFVCDVNKIVVYNLQVTGSSPRIINMPEGDLFVNDLAAFGNDLYVSVTNTDKIYRIDISDLTNIGKPVEWLDIAGPNGLLIGDGTMYVASYPADGKTTDKNVIYRIADLKKAKPEKFITIPGQYDGIAFSTDQQSLYVTNWVPVGLSKISLKTGKMIPLEFSLKENLIGPADITVEDGFIYIPDLPNSRVIKVGE